MYSAAKFGFGYVICFAYGSNRCVYTRSKRIDSRSNVALILSIHSCYVVLISLIVLLLAKQRSEGVRHSYPRAVEGSPMVPQGCPLRG